MLMMYRLLNSPSFFLRTILVLSLAIVPLKESRFVTLQHCSEDPFWPRTCKPPKTNTKFNLTCVPTDSGGFCLVLDPVTFRSKVLARYFPKQPSRDVQELWVRGRGPGLSWNQPVEMRSTGVAGAWSAELEYTVDMQCASLPSCPVSNAWDMEIRVYKGGNMQEDGMIGPSFHFNLPISGSVSGSRSFWLPSVSVSPWFHGTHVAVKEHSIPVPKELLSSFEMSQDAAKYDMVVVYPPSFEDNQDRKYPLVLVLGAEVVRMAATALEHMFVRETSIREAFVVGLSYPGGRECLVLPNVTKEFECKEGLCGADCLTCRDPLRKEPCSGEDFLLERKKCSRVRWCVGRADSFLLFVEDHIIPSVMELTQGRILIEPPTHAVSLLGYHHGGLFACYAGLQRPELFKNVACISPSFYVLQQTAPEKTEYQFTSTLESVLEECRQDPTTAHVRSDQMFYIDVGQNDGLHFPIYPAVDAAYDIVRKLASMGLKVNENLFLMETTGYSSYALFDVPEVSFYYRMFEPLRMFLHTGGNPNMDTMIIPHSIREEQVNSWSILKSSHIDERVVDSFVTNTHNGAGSYGSPGAEHDVHYISTTHKSSCQEKHITVVIYTASVAVTAFLSVIITVVCLCLTNSSLGSRRVKEEASSGGEETSNEDSDSDSEDVSEGSNG